MMKHKDIWQAIDRLAAAHGLTPSGLARKAGLDPTTFNPSKRISTSGRERWPSTESLAQILDATGTNLATFLQFMGASSRIIVRRLPVLGYAQAGKNGFFDDAGFPVGSGWDEVQFPDISDPNAYALEISGDSMEPVYRDGDKIIVSPNVDIRRGDRVVLKTVSGEVMAKELIRETATKVELRSINPKHPDRTIAREDVAWMARILWVSQ